MAKYSIEDTTLTSIADAVRSKTGDSATLTPSEMATAIENIETGDLSEYFKTEGFVNTNMAQQLVEQILIKIPDNIDTSSMTGFVSAFKNFQGTKIPNIDTSNGTDFYEMFSSCPNLITIPTIDVSKGGRMNSFCSNCFNLEYLPFLNTSNITTFGNAFMYCQKLLTFPEYDTSKSTSFRQLFYYCRLLVSVPELNSSKITDVYQMFNTCQKLENFGGLKDLGKAYTQTTSNYSNYRLILISCTNLTHESLMNVINNLYDLNLTYDVANGGTLYTQTLQLGTTNIAKLTEEEIAIATNKGWTVS